LDCIAPVSRVLIRRNYLEKKSVSIRVHSDVAEALADKPWLKTLDPPSFAHKSKVMTSFAISVGRAACPALRRSSRAGLGAAMRKAETARQ